MNIRETLSSFGITSIYHFTDKSNLKSIEKYGIQSLFNIESKNINVSSYGANSLSHELDRKSGLDKFVHLSFLKDHPMYYSAKKRGAITTPIWLELDISILFEDDTLYCDKVANQTNSNIFKIENILDFIDFDKMINEKDFCKRVEVRKAEIMAYSSINLDKIKGVSYGK